MIRRTAEWLRAHPEIGWGVVAATVTAVLVPMAVAAAFGSLSPERIPVLNTVGALSASTDSQTTTSGSAKPSTTATSASGDAVVVSDVTAPSQTSATGTSATSPFSLDSGSSSTLAVIDGDTSAPTKPGALNVVAGSASPVIVQATWNSSTDDVGVAGYYVYTSTSASGTYRKVGTAYGTSFGITNGVPGVDYWVRVVAVDKGGNLSEPAQAGPVRAAWKRLPHASYSSNSEACGSCHQLHNASGGSLMRSDVSTNTVGEVAACYACHDGQGAVTNVRTGLTNSFALGSGHTLEGTATGGDLTNECSGCHDPHRKPSDAPMLPQKTINGKAVSGSGNSMCVACHDASNSWAGGSYPSVSAPTRDAAGYPVSGTWPGPSTYSGASNAHITIPATERTSVSGAIVQRGAGDCQYCHASHRGDNAYDGLVTTFRPTTGSTLASDQAQGTYAALCFTCHGGTPASGFTTAPADVKQFVTAGGQNSGHRIRSAGGTLPVGAPLPCYECHNPHGSKRANASNISDALGANLKTSSAVDVRAFCFSCHSTADTAKGWDSTTSAYAAVSSSDKVVGLPRDGGSLRLPSQTGHNEGDPQSCYSCHGSSYATGGNNVHNPSAGGNHAASAASAECTTCHGSTDVTVVHKATGCATCHNNPKYPALPTGKQPECVSCHNGVDVGTHAYTPPATNHYSETTHTASPFTLAYQGAGATIDAKSQECSACHSAVLPTAHATVSTGTGSVSCEQCHTNTSLSSTTVIKNNWPNRRCTECHSSGTNVTHDAVGSAHVVDPGTCGGSGASCHNSLDLAQLHTTTQSGGAPKYASCYNADPNDPTACHNVRDKRPAPFSKTNSCGQGSGGCHQDKTVGNHAGATSHTFSSASNYNNTTVAGCTNSGGGCHGVESTYANFTTYHPNTGCMAGACHTSPSKPTYTGNRECTSCHNNNFTNAPDVISLAASVPNGHYNETTHTAGGMTGTVKGTSTGTVSATCSNCHNPVDASGMGSLYKQHQNLPSPYANTTCADCHNNSPAVTSVVTTKWATKQCDACHNLTTMPTAAQHGTTAPVVTGTSPATNCAQSGCHASMNLHELHAGKTGGAVTTCALSGCHDYAAQGAKPTATTCGTGGACHTDKADGSHGAATAHTFTAASDYSNVSVSGCTNSGAGCHGADATHSNFASYHPSSGCLSGACHTSPSKPSYTGDHECASCHNNNFVNAPDTIGLAESAPTGHYGETSHTASGLTTNVSAGGTAQATCADCHNPTNLAGVDALYNQHQGLPAPYANTTCYDCHNKNPQVTSVVTNKWPTKQCDACHNALTLPALEQHGASAPTVAATTIGTYSGVSCVSAGCHTTSNLHELHKNASSCAVTGCHDFSQQAKLPTSKSCGQGNACHNVAEPHLHLATAHDGSAVTLPQPGSASVTTTAAATALTENFGTTTTWPTAWTRNSTTYVRVQTTRARSGAAAEVYANSTTRRTFYLERDIDLTNYTSATLTFWDSATAFAGGSDYAMAQYSTNGGTSWTTVSNLTATTAWAQRTATLPVGVTLKLRFTGSVNATTEFANWDDVTISGVQATTTTQALPANSTAAVSCQNNPNGTECHVVTDTRTLHNATANKCSNCHNASGPTNSCQTAGCHTPQFINVDVHNSTNHATSLISTATGEPFAGTGATSTTCTGCHDDSISLEHSVLSAYKNTPCSMCHKKTTNSGAPTNVTTTTVAAAIAKAAGTAECTDCHKTVSASSVHVQRMGTTTTLGSTQFDPTWSGHKVFDTGLGSGTSFANVAGATRTWSLPTATGWLKTGYTTTTMAVRCSDCHGSVTGATGPHGAAMTVNIATGYDNSYSLGTLSLTSTAAMSNTTNLCAKCHQTTLSTNTPHSNGQHQGTTNGKCIACHVKTPHAWKRPRLLGYTTDPTPYRSTNLTGIVAKNYTPTGWVASDCGQTGCGQHSASVTPLWP